MALEETNPAAGGLVDIAYKAETALGSATVGGTYQKYPTTRTSMKLTKDVIQSNIRSSSRQRKNARHGYRGVAGDLMGELQAQAHDDFMQAALGGNWASGAASGSLATASLSIDGLKLKAAGATFITAGFKVGDIFTIVSAQQNAASGLRHQIASITETEIEVYGSTLPSTTLTSCVVAVVGKKVAIGNTLRSFTIERIFSNGLNQPFTGCRINNMKIDVPPSGIPGTTFGVIGVDMTGLTSTAAGSTYTSAVTTNPMFSVIGALYEGTTKTAIGEITGFSLTYDNAMQPDKVAFRRTTPNINFGKFAGVTGQMTVLFNSPTIYNKFVNENESTIDAVLYDDSATDTANFIRIHLERVKYNDGDIDDSADTSIPITLNFEAYEPLGTTGRETRALVIQTP